MKKELKLNPTLTRASVQPSSGPVGILVSSDCCQKFNILKYFVERKSTLTIKRNENCSVITTIQNNHTGGCTFLPTPTLGVNPRQKGTEVLINGQQWFNLTSRQSNPTLSGFIMIMTFNTTTMTPPGTLLQITRQCKLTPSQTTIFDYL